MFKAAGDPGSGDWDEEGWSRAFAYALSAKLAAFIFGYVYCAFEQLESN
jgi:hypothetical protein